MTVINDMPPIEEFISMGYYVTAFVDEPGLGEEWWSSHRRDTFVSVSHCINDEWAPDVEWHNPTYGKWGLHRDSSRIEPEGWLSLCGEDHGFPSTFLSLPLARRFISEFLDPNPRRILIAFAIHRDDWPRLKDIADHERANLPENCMENSELTTARLGVAPDASAELLGYDIIAFDANPGCCWYCGSHDDDLREKFGIHANQYGLIGSFAEAVKAARYIDDPDTNSEPGLWLPVAVFRYGEEAP